MSEKVGFGFDITQSLLNGTPPRLLASSYLSNDYGTLHEFRRAKMVQIAKSNKSLDGS